MFLAVGHVVDTFTQFLDQIANEQIIHVEHVIYSLYPPHDGITSNINELRQGMQAACAASVVPCHFLDLQFAWEGNEDAYYGPGRVNPSSTGAARIADEIWKIMKESCIAQ